MWTSKTAPVTTAVWRYPSDLTDDEWRLVEQLIPPARPPAPVDRMYVSPFASSRMMSVRLAPGSNRASLDGDGAPISVVPSRLKYAGERPIDARA